MTGTNQRLARMPRGRGREGLAARPGRWRPRAAAIVALAALAAAFRSPAARADLVPTAGSGDRVRQPRACPIARRLDRVGVVGHRRPRRFHADGQHRRLQQSDLVHAHRRHPGWHRLPDLLGRLRPRATAPRPVPGNATFNISGFCDLAGQPAPHLQRTRPHRLRAHQRHDQCLPGDRRSDRQPGRGAHDQQIRLRECQQLHRQRLRPGLSGM